MPDPTDTPAVVPADADDTWAPEGYEPGPDDPGPVTETHGEHEDDVTDGNAR